MSHCVRIKNLFSNTYISPPIIITIDPSYFSSWEDTWILDTGATCHMTFRRDCFETFSNHINGIVYFAHKSQLKPSGIRSIRLCLQGLVDYILTDVLYIPQLKRNLMPSHTYQAARPFYTYVWWYNWNKKSMWLGDCYDWC